MGINMNIQNILLVACILTLSGCLSKKPIPPALNYADYENELLFREWNEELNNCHYAVDKVKAYAQSTSTSYTTTHNSNMASTKNGYQYSGTTKTTKTNDNLSHDLLKVIDPDYVKSDFGLDLNAREACRNTHWQTKYMHDLLDTRSLTPAEQETFDQLYKDYQFTMMQYDRYVQRGRK